MTEGTSSDNCSTPLRSNASPLKNNEVEAMYGPTSMSTPSRSWRSVSGDCSTPETTGTPRSDKADRKLQIASNVPSISLCR